MMGEKELDQLIQQLRRYHRAIRATSGGLPQFQTPETQAQLEQRLQTAYTIKAELEEELDGFLQQAQLWLEAQQGRLETARAQRKG
jgi:hypothetical protein